MKIITILFLLTYSIFADREIKKQRKDIKSLEQVIDNQDKLLTKCGIY